MANSVFRPTQPHFFQPILQNSHTHLTIPEAFFVRYLEGKKPRSAVLKSNGGERSWRVKINGRRITDGWKEFVGCHDLRVGDIVLFRLESRLVFHVTAFGLTGCEKQNAPFNDSMQKDASFTGETLEEETEEEESDEAETEEEETSQESVNKRPKKRSRSKVAVSDKSSFVATVTPSSIKYNTMFFPRKFAQSSGLLNKSGLILLMNKQKRIWKSRLTKKADGAVYIRGGWKRFCVKNNLKVSDLYGFNLTWNATTPIITLMDSDELLEASGKFSKTNEATVCSRRRVSCSASQGFRFLTLVVSANALSRGRQYLPKRFVRSNGLNRGHDEITVMDKNEFCWVINLCYERSSERVHLGRGWKRFCIANGFKKRDSIRLELVPGKKLMLRLLP